MAYDKFTLDSVLVLIETLHYQYEGEEAEAVHETLNWVGEHIKEMKKAGDES